MPPKKSNRVDPDKDTIVDAASEASKSNLEFDVLQLQFGGDFLSLTLKRDHATRPIWVCPDGRLFLEAFSPLYKQAYDFLVTIAEPVSRPQFIHEYKLTSSSLIAATSVGLEPDSIITVLEKLSKTPLPDSFKDIIRNCTEGYGKVRLVLQNGRYFLESPHADVLRRLLKVETIQKARINASDEEDDFITLDAPMEEKTSLEASGVLDAMEEEEEEDATAISRSRSVVAIELMQEGVEKVKQVCLRLKPPCPIVEEYAWRLDQVNPSLHRADLKPNILRDYQLRCLNKMFGNGRARSGIIVLPCGAGKTLVGITACCTLKKRCLILCTNGVSVWQWKASIKQFTNVREDDIVVFTSKDKEHLPPADKACICITTYSMISFTGKRSAGARKVMDVVSKLEWGLLVLDEVHVVPAKIFRSVITLTHAHCKLGLTATLVREDDLIQHLAFLIGPKLFEANWMDLTNQGYLARVHCTEVWCPMTAEFYAMYLKQRSRAHGGKQQLLAVLNPNKLRTVSFLVSHHVKRGHQVIIFSDSVYALKGYARILTKLLKLDVPYLCGETSGTERAGILKLFRENVIKVLVLSKVGDVAIDLPEAKVLIQISSHFGSRRQEAQRLGRILRPKSRAVTEVATRDSLGDVALVQNVSGDKTVYDAFFYTLVSTDTREMVFSEKRRQYLIDQGYSFYVDNKLGDNEYLDGKVPPLTMVVQRDMLEHIMSDDTDTPEKREQKVCSQADLDDVSLTGSAIWGSVTSDTLSGGTGSYPGQKRKKRKKGDDVRGRLKKATQKRARLKR